MYRHTVFNSAVGLLLAIGLILGNGFVLAANLPVVEVKQHIERALKHTSGQIEGASGAAKMLDLNPHTLRAKMRKLGIDWGAFRS